MPQLDSLGLKENPFKNNLDQRFFYADQNRAQILESTEHLIEYSSNLQVIIGSEGLGKSHLLETLASRMDNNWRIARIREAGQYDTLSLIQAILEAFGANPEPEQELLESLETLLAEIIQLGFKPVLFIDDAQALSVDSIRFLAQLSQQKQDDESYINIVLCSTLEITEHLQSPELKDYRDVIHIATLSPLDKEGVSSFLRHKMSVAGFDRESPFTPRIIDSIYNDSKGVPEKINFYANKFLVSSGKGQEYINDKDRNNSEASSSQESDFMSTLDDTDLKPDRTDRAEDQINRLAEKFDEIEKMGQQPVDDFFIDNKSMNQDLDDDSLEQAFEEESQSFGLPKFVIPVAIIGIVLAAVIIINNVFDQNEPGAEGDGVTQQATADNIELLPLELPAENSLEADDSNTSKNSDETDTTAQLQASDAASTADKMVTFETSATETSLPATEEALEEAADDTVTSDIAVEPIEVEPIQTHSDAIEQPVEPVIIPATENNDAAKTPALPAPELKMILPEPVIGSNIRQTLSVVGRNLDKTSTLMMSWADNSKAFSQTQTPQQWNYISPEKIELKLTTGVQAQQWQIYAKNEDGQQSKVLSFDVVKPFSEKITIKEILPNPVTGSDKRQAVTIRGQGFSKQTVFELKWDKNSKHLSSRLSPSQFEYISSTEIKLFITTGTKERKWKVIARTPDSNATSVSAFNVVSKTGAVSAGFNQLQDSSWLKQQADDHYTIQLFGSHKKQAIDELIKAYGLKGDLAWFETQRNGQSWYSLTYGNYETRAQANAAIASLDAKLVNPKPWIRNFESIKKQIGSAPPEQASLTSPQKQPSSLPKPVASGVLNEAWIWTQNPTDYTVQLLALSTEKAIQDFAKKHQIETKSVNFKITRNGQPLYILIYGNYPDKNTAEAAKKQLTTKIKGSKPWVRSFSDIHSMMSP